MSTTGVAAAPIGEVLTETSNHDDLTQISPCTASKQGEITGVVYFRGLIKN